MASTTPQSLTAFAAAKIVNAALIEAGLTKQIPPQMVYNYTTARVRKGQKPLIPTVQVKVDGKDTTHVQVEGLTAWIKRYVAKQVAIAGALATIEAEEAETATSE
jgi:hypothetical protein